MPETVIMEPKEILQVLKRIDKPDQAETVSSDGSESTLPSSNLPYPPGAKEVLGKACRITPLEGL